MKLKLDRRTKATILMGFKVIGFILGYGIIFLMSAISMGVLIQANYFDVYTEYAKWIVPAIPTAGIIYLVLMILRFATHEPHCHHCGKNLMDEKENKWDDTSRSISK